MSDERSVPEASPAPRRRALGRGLDTLLPAGPPSGLRMVGVERIEANPNQPRHRMDSAATGELAASIREHGVLQPLMVTELGAGRFRLIVGERRWQAARAAGLSEVPVIVREATDRQTLELALIENVQRTDLNPLEEAAAYQRLMQEFGLTQQALATQVGRGRVAVANAVRLLSLPESLKRALAEGRISEGHARALLGLPGNQDRMAALDRIEREDLSVRQTEELVRRMLHPGKRRKAPPALHPDVAAAEEDLRRALGTKVSLRRGRRGGRIVIEYFSDEEFDALYRRLMGED
jgi:ParB family transcriptional regulator, chromosome partitioning protein